MFQNKRHLCLLLAIILAFSLLPLGTAFAAPAAAPCLSVSRNGAVRGQTVSVDVTLTDGAGVYGGTIDISYDPDVLTISDATAGDAVSDSLVQINKSIAPGTVRMSFASGNAIKPQGVVCTLTFAIIKSAQPGEYPVSLVNYRMYDQVGNNLDILTDNGCVTVQCVTLTVESKQAVASQSVKIDVELGGDLSPAGGSFCVCYDSSKLTPGSAVAGSALNGCSFVCNEKYDTGIIKISWASDSAVEAKGQLCTLTFNTKETAAGVIPLKIDNVRVYDTETSVLDTVANDGYISIEQAQAENPKLWIVGGAMEDDNSASVGVVLEGRGAICGGSFTLSYDSSKCQLASACSEIEAQGGCAVINSPLLKDESNALPEGTLKFSWAGATPTTESVLLLNLRFNIIEPGSNLTISEASLLDSATNASEIVDIRSGKVCSSEITLQPPQVGALEVKQDSNSTSVGMTVDIANAAQYTKTINPDYSAVVILKENGSIKTINLDLERSSIQFDNNGIAHIDISASCIGTFDTVQLVLLKSDGSFAPCSECLNKKI